MPDRLPALREDATRLALTLSDAHVEAFEAYLGLVEEWNERAGLTSVSDRDEMQRRHFGESLALLVALREAGVLPAPMAEGDRTRIADLGPGGGFPGVPMRILEPALDLVLVESNQRRAEFLRHLVASLALDRVEVVTARAEEAGRDPALREGFDLVVARALAPLAVLVEYGVPLLRRGGVLATPKGSRAAEELAEAAGALAALGAVALDLVPLSLPAGAPPQTVLVVRREGDLDERYPRRPGIPSKRPLA
ncbi:MAG: 16S rRNA (guanine(527)-N(7))-methyltransferase RsmG [Dehalococcoidia bacterium]|nr:16S rRNA (guanine(527)-N(7))-methyltransferase RsmG [Dehalococcoidia bacterium]